MTNSPDERGAELRELFFETSQELLQALNEEALKLEKKPGDEEIVRAIRRTVHTLKGDSAACGLRELSELAHQFEDALSLDGSATQAAVAEIAFAAADLFAEMIGGLPQGQQAAFHQDSEQEDSGTDRRSMPGKNPTYPEGRRQGEARQGLRGARVRQVGGALDRVRKAGHDQSAGERPGGASRRRQDRSALRHADRGPPVGSQRAWAAWVRSLRCARMPSLRRRPSTWSSCWPVRRPSNRLRPRDAFRPSPKK